MRQTASTARQLTLYGPARAGSSWWWGSIWNGPSVIHFRSSPIPTLTSSPGIQIPARQSSIQTRRDNLSTAVLKWSVNSLRPQAGCEFELTTCHASDLTDHVSYINSLRNGRPGRRRPSQAQSNANPNSPRSTTSPRRRRLRSKRLLLSSLSPWTAKRMELYRRAT